MQTRLTRTIAADGLSLTGLVHTPNGSSRGAVILVHGSAGSFYGPAFGDALADALTASGWTLVRGQNRGHGHITDFPVLEAPETSRRIGNASETFTECGLDIAAWMAVVPDLPQTVLLGHSLGASKVVYHAAHAAPGAIRGLVLASPVDMVRLYAREPDHPQRAADAARLHREGRGGEFIQGLIRDHYLATADHYLEWTRRGGPIDVFNVMDTGAGSPDLALLTIPVLALLGSEEGDLLERSPAAELALHASRAINCPRFDTTVIQGANHTYDQQEHLVAGRVAEWLDAVDSA